MNYYIFLLGSLALGSECYDYLFTDCEHNGTRTAVFFPTQKCENFTLPEPIFNLSCNLECPAGKYLDLDIDTLQSKCSECPANTFSIGGGEKFLQNDWGNFVYSFSTYCWTMGFYNWELNSNCEAWHSKNGQTVSSGSAFEDTWFESSLVYHAHMVKNGTVKFTYRKEMNIHNNATNGLFAVYIDDDQVLRDKDATQIGWKTVVLEIPIGLHNIAFIYDKYSTNQDNNAEISYFEIRGTQSASHFCSPCETGFSNPGSDSCDICPANSFYFPTATQNCLECPDDNYSLPGSTSIVDCKPRQDCTESDYS